MSDTSDKEGKRPSIAELALPSILGNLLFAIVGMVQTKFVGELGAESLAEALKDGAAPKLQTVR